MISMLRSGTLQSLMLALSALVSSALGQAPQLGPDSARFAVRMTSEYMFRIGGENITIQTEITGIFELRITRATATSLRVRTRVDSIAFTGTSTGANVDMGPVSVKKGDTVAFTIATTGELESVQSGDSGSTAMLHDAVFGIELPRRCAVLPCSWDSDVAKLSALSLDGFEHDPALIASALAGMVRRQLSDTNVAGSRMVRLETSSLDRAPGKPVRSFQYRSTSLVDANGRMIQTNATSTIEVDPASGNGVAPVRGSTRLTVERLPASNREGSGSSASK